MRSILTQEEREVFRLMMFYQARRFRVESHHRPVLAGVLAGREMVFSVILQEITVLLVFALDARHLGVTVHVVERQNVQIPFRSICNGY